MEYRVFSKYYKLSLIDKVKPITCLTDPDHPPMVPNLFIDENDKELIYFYCLGCKCKLYPGIDMYNEIELMLKQIEDNE